MQLCMKPIMAHIHGSIAFSKQYGLFISESLLEDFGGIILFYLVKLSREETRHARNTEQVGLDR